MGKAAAVAVRFEERAAAAELAGLLAQQSLAEEDTARVQVVGPTKVHACKNQHIIGSDQQPQPAHRYVVHTTFTPPPPFSACAGRAPQMFWRAQALLAMPRSKRRGSNPVAYPPSAANEANEAGPPPGYDTYRRH